MMFVVPGIATAMAKEEKEIKEAAPVRSVGTARILGCRWVGCAVRRGCGATLVCRYTVGFG